jgi:hypothetical protein
MVTYSHAEVIASIEKAIKEGRAAQAAGQQVSENPYPPASRYGSWWNEGWYREQEGK